MDVATPPSRSLQISVKTAQIIRWVLGILIGGWMLWRIVDVIFIQKTYGPDTWVRFALSGLILGGMYALIAIGYTLVYGILFMINFAHGDVMMLGAFGGYFVFEIFKKISYPYGRRSKASLLKCSSNNFSYHRFYCWHARGCVGRILP